MQRTIAMLVGGGPAPGLNGVINAVTLSARARGWKVLGVPKGFSQLMKGDTSGVRELTEADVSGIETRGGSILFTSRANPTKKPEDLQKVVEALRSLGVTDLVTLGGDDTATSATKVAAAAGGGMRAVHVPKTIDNDLPLPGNAPTFGFETAKYLGHGAVQEPPRRRADDRTMVPHHRHGAQRRAPDAEHGHGLRIADCDHRRRISHGRDPSR
jgi:6-phosphofructokinase 1